MPYYNKPFKNLESTSPLTTAELRSEIAARTHIDAGVVELVFDTMREVVTEEIVNKGAFNFTGLFRVKNFQTKPRDTPLGHVPGHPRLSIVLSDRVKKLWNSRLRNGIIENRSFGELIEDFNQASQADDQINGQASNPMLEEDEDY